MTASAVGWQASPLPAVAAPRAAVRAVLYATVFITGAAVLVLEVTAVRILSPYFGSSLLVFSSILSVVLGALSLGYFVGGRLADRWPRHPPLYLLIALGGLAVLAAPWLAGLALPSGGHWLASTAGPVLFSLLLFFVPAFLLGIDSPYVIRLLCQDRPPAQTGAVAGTTFFCGTLGSICGSMLTGFVLVPQFGVRLTVQGTALSLVFLGLAGSLLLSHLQAAPGASPWRLVRAQGGRVGAILAVAIVGVAALAAAAPEGPLTARTIHAADGVYSRLLVDEGYYRGRPVRTLRQDAVTSSAVYLDSHDLPLGYTQFAEFHRVLVPGAGRLLMIGGGSFAIPRTLLARDPALQVTVAELEPRLLPLARTYFDLPDTPRLGQRLLDGRVLLQQESTPYDVVFGDAFGSDLTLPFHLATREFFVEVQRDLAPGGVFMLNTIGRPEAAAPSLIGSLARTLQSVFPNLRAYALDIGHPGRVQNVVFIARNGNAPIDLGALTITTADGRVVQAASLAWPLQRFDLPAQRLLTDDHAPVESLMLAERAVSGSVPRRP